jgi:AAA domain
MHLSPTKLADYVRHGFCDRFLLRAGSQRGHGPEPTRFDDVLRRRGIEAQFEFGQLLGPDRGWRPVEESDFDCIIDRVDVARRAGDRRPLVATEVLIAGTIGPATFGGGDLAERPRIDFLLVTWPVANGGLPAITIVECKASVRDRLEHYVQLGAYFALARDRLTAKRLPWPTDGLVVRRPAPGQAMSPLGFVAGALDRTALDGLSWLSTDELVSLVVDIQAQLHKAARSQETDPVQFSSACADCAYNGDCLRAAIDGTRTQELLCLPPDQHRALLKAGVRWDNQHDWPQLRQAARAAGYRAGWAALFDVQRVRRAYYFEMPQDAEVHSSGFARLPDVDTFARDAPFLQVFVAADRDQVGQRFAALALRAVLQSADGKRQELSASAHCAGEIGDAHEEAALVAEFGRSLMLVIDEALKLSPHGVYVHLYAWRHEELAGLAKRCLDLIDREGVTDFPDIERLLDFLTRHEGLSRLEEADTLDTEECWEERVFTGISEEAARRLKLGAVGTTLIEASCLRWRADCVDGLATDVWLRDPILVEQLPSILRMPEIAPPQFASQLRAIMRRRMHFFDSCPPEVAQQMRERKPFAEAWLNACTLAIERIEGEFRCVVGAGKLAGIKKVIHALNPFSHRVNTGHFPILDAAMEYLSLDSYYRKKAWYAGLMFSPDDLLARERAVSLDKLEWELNSKRMPRPIGWKQLGVSGHLDQWQADAFRHGKPISGHPRLIPYRDRNERLSLDDITIAAFATSGISWPRGDGPHRIDRDYLALPFRNAQKSSRHVSNGNDGIFGTARPAGPVFPDQSVLWVSNFNPTSHEKLLDWFRSSRERPDSFAPVAWFDPRAARPVPSVEKLSEEVHQQILGVLQRFSSVAGETRKQITTLYKERANIEQNKSSYCAAVLAQVVRAIGAVPRKFDEFEDPEENRRRAQVWTSIINALNCRVSLVQGPPGTGKTEFGVRLILAWLTGWLLNPRNADQVPRIIVTACTHKALENVVVRLIAFFDLFRSLLPPTPGLNQSFRLRVVKVAATDNCAKLADYSGSEEGDDDDEAEGDRRSSVLLFRAKTDRPRQILDHFAGLPILPLDGYPTDAQTELGFFRDDNADDALRRRAFCEAMPTLIAVTSNRLATITRSGFFRDNPADLMLIDEASMLVLSDFLAALPALDASHGQIVMIGDDRQLGPIVSGAWGDEIRPLIRKYRPYESAFAAIRRIATAPNATNDGRIRIDALDYCYRCARDVWRLVAPIYARDGITLKGEDRDDAAAVRVDATELLVRKDWKGVRLIAYDGNVVEGLSTENAVEAEIIHLLSNQPELKAKQIGIVTPYNKQVSLISSKLKSLLNEAREVTVATVNRFQGDEFDTIIVSAVGTSKLLRQQEEFLLELNRTNVAFTRAMNRLIVVCSYDMLNYVARTAETYDASLIWKRLRDTTSTAHGNFEVSVAGTAVRCGLFGTA